MSRVGLDRGILKLVANWSDQFEKKFYNLALFEMQAASEREPENPLVWFLLGTTQLALHRDSAAREAFEKARGLESQSISHSELRPLAANLVPALDVIEEALQRRVHLSPPQSPFEWLENPAEIRRQIKGAPAPAPAARANPKGATIHSTPTAPPLAMTPSTPSSAPRSPEVRASEVRAAPSSPWTPKPEPEALVAPSLSAPVLSDSPAASSPWAQWEAKLREYVERGNFGEALKQVDLALTRHDKNAWLAEWRARILEKDGRKGEAAEQYLRAVQLALNQGDKAKAEDLVKIAGDLAQGNGDLLLSLGAIMAAIGMTDRGRDALRGAEAMFRRANDHPKLVAALRGLLKLSPENPALVQELARLTQRASRGEPFVVPLKPGKGGLGRVSPPKLNVESQPSPPPLQAGRMRRPAALPASQAAQAKASLISFFLIFIGAIFGFSGVGVVPLVCLFVVSHMAKSVSGSKGLTFLLGIGRLVLIAAAIVGFVGLGR